MSVRFAGMAASMLAAFALAACNNRDDRALQGWVEAELIFISPDEQGRVEQERVREGDRVNKGDLLFALDADLQASDVAVRESAVTTSEQNFARAKQLLTTNAGTQKTYDDAEAALRQAKANLDWAKTRLARRRGISPADGTIQEVYFRPGETVPPGRAVMSLLPPGNLKLRFFVPEARLPDIKYGQTATVSCDGCERGLTAKVSFIAKSAEYTPPVIYSREERSKLVFLVEARPAEPEKFRVGQPVTVTLPNEDKK
jgi:HlyD family secretion protein